MHPGQQAAAGIARHPVRAHRHQKAVALHVLQLLHAVVGFAVLGVGFPAHGVADPGGGHQVAFVGGVDEHGGAEFQTAFHADRADPLALHRDAVFTVQPLLEQHRHFCFAQHLVEDGRSRVRLERPGGLFVRAVPPPLELFPAFPTPVLGVLIPLPQTVVELASHAADCLAAAGIRVAQPSGGQPTQVPRRLDQHHRLAHPPHLHRRDDSGRSASIDHHVHLPGRFVRGNDLGRGLPANPGQ